MSYPLLLGLFFCHFLADFTPLSSPWMLRAKENGAPLFPIFIHASVHGVLMLALLLLFFSYEISAIVIVIGLQVLSHFCIDVLKGRVSAVFLFLKSNQSKGYWVAMGADQYLHASILLTMAAILH